MLVFAFSHFNSMNRHNQMDIEGLMLKDPPYLFPFSFVKFVILIVVLKHEFLQEYLSFFDSFYLMPVTLVSLLYITNSFGSPLGALGSKCTCRKVL